MNTSDYGTQPPSSTGPAPTPTATTSQHVATPRGTTPVTGVDVLQVLALSFAIIVFGLLALAARAIHRVR